MAAANGAGDGIFSATYNGNPIWEFQFVGPDAKREHVMRRQSDNWVNATHILKAAGFDKPARTRILERDVQKGNHEKVQGGYGKFQGTYLPLADAQELARQHNVLDRIGPIFDFVPGAVTPPPAPRHVSKPKQPKKSAAVPQPGPAAKKRKRNDPFAEDLDRSSVAFRDDTPDDQTVASGSYMAEDDADRMIVHRHTMYGEALLDYSNDVLDPQNSWFEQLKEQHTADRRRLDNEYEARKAELDAQLRHEEDHFVSDLDQTARMVREAFVTVQQSFSLAVAKQVDLHLKKNELHREYERTKTKAEANLLNKVQELITGSAAEQNRTLGSALEETVSTSSTIAVTTMDQSVSPARWNRTPRPHYFNATRSIEAIPPGADVHAPTPQTLLLTPSRPATTPQASPLQTSMSGELPPQDPTPLADTSMATTTSTLSELTRTPTPPSNDSTYLTASECNSGSASLTEPSSPASDSRDDSAHPKAVYRDALGLPRELKLRCHIHLEEQYYIAALNLLNSLLCDGIPPAHAQPNRPGCVAPPAQMAVLGTLAIHPKHTSKLTDTAAHDVSSLAMSYLRTVLATVGPVNANLRDAFLFRGESGRRRRSDRSAAGLGGMESGDEDHVRGKTANKGSLWVRGQDFWRVLGWAFNCSAQHPHRWRWWQPWLEYMVDVLEADYRERKRLDIEREGASESYEYQLLQESLLVSYVVPKNSRVSPLKPIISALFADGNTSSQAIFKEVFTRENKVPSKTNKKRKRDRVDLENDKFGDYDDDSSTGGSEPSTPEHLRMLALDVKNDTALWTGSSLLDTIPLRLRLFALLSEAAYDIPGKCMISLPDLYEKSTERIAQLPVAAFTKFLAQHETPLPEGSLVAIIRCLMPYLLPGTAPRPGDVDAEADAREDISTRILERCYLPFAYRTAENNAKISLALETMLRLDFCTWSMTLQHAVEKGVAARNNKAAPRKGGRFKTDSELAAQEMLRASGKRLLAWVSILKMEYDSWCRNPAQDL